MRLDTSVCIYQPCRPLCPAFKASRRRAVAGCSSAGAVPFQQDSDAVQPRSTVAFTSHSIQVPDQLEAAEEANLPVLENAATLGTLRALTARVHQGCVLLIQAGCYRQCLKLLRASSFLILDEPLPNAQLGSQLLQGLIHSTNTDTALTALPLVAPSVKLYMAGIKGFAQRGSVRGVREMAAFAMREGFLQGPESRDLWLSLVGAYGHLGRAEQARVAFKSMQQQGAWGPHDTHAANVLLHALHSDPLKQFVRWRQFEAAGVRPDTSTFNVLLKGCMRAKDARRAELAYGWMQQAGVQGDEITFNTLIKVFSYAGQFEKVLGVRELMVRQGFEATPRIWGSLLVACGVAGHLEQAHVLWGELKQRHRELVEGAAGGALDRVDGPDPSLSELSLQGGRPPVGGQRQGQGQQQRQQQEGQECAGVGLLGTEVFNAMMLACIEGYQGEQALHVFRELRDTPGAHPDHRSFNLVIKGCESPPARTLRPEQLATALALTAEMEAAGLQPDVFTYGTLIDLCARGKHGARALQLYQEMEARGVRANKTVVSSLFKALGAAGMVEECMAVFRRIVWGPARLRPNHATFRHLLHALKESGALQEALSVYQGMREMGYPPSRQEFSELVSVAAERALRQQDSALQSKVLELASIKSCREVDLHGMSSTEARAAVLCVLSQVQQQCLARGAPSHQLLQGDSTGEHGAPGIHGGVEPAEPGLHPALHDIVIITGAGRNSTAGEAVLPGVVLKLLREELGIGVQLNPQAPRQAARDGLVGRGVQPLPASQETSGDVGEGSEGSRRDAAERINAGRMVITRAALQQWIEGKKARQRGEARMEPGPRQAEGRIVD